MSYSGAFSAEMQNLLEEQGQANLLEFAGDFFQAVEERRPAAGGCPPLTTRDYA
jgi:hypothetical protein